MSLFEEILKQNGFIQSEHGYYNPVCPWVIAHMSEDGMALRPFMGRSKSFRKKQLFEEALDGYMNSKDHEKQYRFAVEFFDDFIKDLNWRYPHAIFTHKDNRNGVPVLRVQFPNSDVHVKITNYQKFMIALNTARLKNFAVKSHEVLEDMLLVQHAQPIVVKLGTDIYIYAEPEALRNVDLWRLHNVVSVKTLNIVPVYENCPPALVDHLAPTMTRQYVEFICKL